MIRIAVVDDENTICSILEDYIENICDCMQIEAEIDVFTTGEGFIRYLAQDNVYHLVFLDIELSCCTGIDVSRHIRDELRDNSTQIVFISGKNGYDRQLFEFCPLHFIPKPFSKEKIIEVISKYIRIYGNKNEIFQYKFNHINYWVKFSDIIYFESADRKILLNTTSGKQEFYGSLYKIQEQLKNKVFIMPHKSYLVNYQFIRLFRPDCIIMSNGSEIPISKSNRKEIAKLQLLMENGGKHFEY